MSLLFFGCLIVVHKYHDVVYIPQPAYRFALYDFNVTLPLRGGKKKKKKKKIRKVK